MIAYWWPSDSIICCCLAIFSLMFSVAFFLSFYFKLINSIHKILSKPQKIQNGKICTHNFSLFFIVKQFRFDFTFGFKSGNNILVFPADFVWDTAQLAELNLIFWIDKKNFFEMSELKTTYSSSWLEFDGTKTRWHNHTLLFVIRRWNTFQGLKFLQSLFASLCLVWDHSFKDIIFLVNGQCRQWKRQYLPLTVLQKIFPGARKWMAPRFGLMAHLLRKNSKYLTLQ